MQSTRQEESTDVENWKQVLIEKATMEHSKMLL